MPNQLNYQWKLGNNNISHESPTFIIAEVAQAHDGSLGFAHAYIDAAADAGANAVKFQTHIAAEESTLDEPFRIKFSKQDKTRYDYWKRMEFTPEQWQGLRDHAYEKNIIFLSTAFSIKAVEILENLNIEAWKVPSGETLSFWLLDAMAKSKKPMILSSGMSSLDEVKLCFNHLKRQNVKDLAIMQCTSTYPTPLEKVGLNVIEEYKDLFNCPTGLSDHSGSIYPAFAAIARKTDFLELHITFDKHMFGPDVSSSITIDQLREICNFRDALYKMDSHPVDKSSHNLTEMKTLFNRSLSPTRDLRKGDIIQKSDITLKKPGTGIPQDQIDNIIGKKVKCDIPQNRLINWKDIDKE